jgi:hypothetical protein
VADGFRVDLAALRDAADGVRRTVEQVAVASSAPVGSAAGHDALAEALDGFLDRWRRGVQGLVEDGAAIADRLDGDARAYGAVDDAGRAGLLSGPDRDPAAG